MVMSDLASVLDEYEPDELRVTKSHDGVAVYRITGETNQWGEPDDELLWRWDPAHDREPFDAIELLFMKLGYTVEQL